MAQPRRIDTPGGRVVVKLMDDSWIWNECVGAHPIVPSGGVVWSHSDCCARLPVPGDELPGFARAVRDEYGNCAAMAWSGGKVLGHIVWLPRVVARRRLATGWEAFGPESEDEGRLVVVNLAFCSLSGHEYRGCGVGAAMAELMLDWAAENGWHAVEVYGASGGLFPLDWYDSCIPPRPFWEGRGFEVFAHRGGGGFTDEQLAEYRAEDPRDSPRERAEVRRILAGLRSGEIDGADYCGLFDLRRCM